MKLSLMLPALNRAVRTWFDSESYYAGALPSGATASITPEDEARIDWLRIIPFVLLHVTAVIGIVVSDISLFAICFGLGTYCLRMFAITAFYHRYFAHRAFRTSRLMQFLFAVLGATATQRGPLWWAAHHRRHHRHADEDQDPHTPRHGFWWSHMGWFLCRKNFVTDLEQVRDLAIYPELRWLDRHELLIPVLFALSIFVIGEVFEAIFPGLRTNGWQLLVWGYFVSTVVLIHVTLMINSVAHRWGQRRYRTKDDSRNNWILAVLTLGEGWHNNHHHFPGAARQGFYWWEVDISYYLLRLMAGLRLIDGLKTVPEGHLDKRRVES